MTEPRVPRGSTADAARLRELLALALRASSGRHADAARDVVLTILLAHLLADAGHDGPPHGSPRAPRRGGKAPKSHHAGRSALSGRRPRG
ncbi:hypothetical protein OM076_26685 [Solirubrobacter ginsenosidimutans]|uniref:Uncharacterized protein n=1 Tax=Solirubrobacter ginsenosidimutans TaxID=490573 RepID=A0A9X3MYC1_9ACTN|nr:hypothetical protein [Solirubrobacter ginsenosidimutans]MDA0163886.1 hypothetical protein [Solirubrobacter ginsenosidimutans]